MKKIVCLIVLITLFLCACDNTNQPHNDTVEITNLNGEVDDIYIGMVLSNVDIERIINDPNYVSWRGHYFYTNSNGNYVYFKSVDGKVAEIKCYRSQLINPTPEKFALITKDMSLPDVIKLVGIPSKFTYAEMDAFVFKDTNRNDHVVRFYDDIECIVSTDPAKSSPESIQITSEITDLQGEVSDLRIGMSYEDVYSIVSQNEHFQYWSYIYYTNANGNFVVCRFSYDNKLAEIRCYDSKRIDPTPDKFALIYDRMPIFDVVGLVGNPCDSFTSGMSTLAFMDTSGDFHTIYLNDDTHFFVHDVIAP